jgi:hypothetical protein
MKRSFAVIVCLIFYAGLSMAQKAKADPDFYPMAYSGDTWTGEVTAFDNDRRTLTLTYVNGKNAQTFVASIPDSPYEWRQDARSFRVVDFPFDKEAEYQTFTYKGPGLALTVLPSGVGANTQKRQSPPASNVITDFTEFMGKRVTVYYTAQERKVGGAKEKYNDVWRIRILPAKKK